jgi:hypothetical protein
MRAATVPSWLLSMTGNWTAEFNIRVIERAAQQGIPLEAGSAALKALIERERRRASPRRSRRA